MFTEKFLMSDVLATNLMLTGLLFLFPMFVPYPSRIKSSLICDF